jgi:DNA repair protein RadC
MNTNSQLPLSTVHSSRAARLRESPAWRIAYGADTPSLVEALSVIIGGNKALETAERLLAHFGDIHTLDKAAPDELASIAGVSFATAARLKAALMLGRRMLAPLEERPVIRSPADAAAILQPRLMGREQEYLYVLLLNTRNAVIGEPIEIYHGSLNTSLIRIGEVFKDAIRVNAAGIVIAHNHPSGDPSPSPEDVAVTRAIREAGKLLDIELVDHLVIGQGCFTSLKERGLGFN